MSFLAPWMLAGAAAASIPVILHFFYRSRYRTVPWGAMKFLLAAIEQTSRRLRFQELLLLALRVLMLLLLALAFARPTSTASNKGAAGDAVDAVFVIDTSMSMGQPSGVAPVATANAYLADLKAFAAEDNTVTCFARAKASALAVLAALPPQSTVRVVSCADRASLLGPRVPSQLDQARKVLEDLDVTSLGSDLLPGVALAADLLRQGPSPNKELYVFTDMQRSAWDARSTALAEKLNEVREIAGVHVVRCTPTNAASVAVVSITPQTTLRAGERADFAVLLRNTGTEAAKNLTVTLDIDDNPALRDAQPVASIDAGATRAVVLSGVLEKPGRHILSASVKPDPLSGDNRLDQIINVSDQVGVLLVDGSANFAKPAESGSYYLSHALNPLSPGVASQLPVTVIGSERASPRDLGGKELCVLVNCRLEADRGDDAPRLPSALPSDFTRALAEFVASGKSVLIFAGDRVDPKLYNAVLFEQLRLLPYRIKKAESTPEDKPWNLDRATAEAQPFDRFRAEQGFASIDRVKVRSYLDLDAEAKDPELAEESRVLLRYSNGRPAVVSRRRPNQGEVMLFTTSVSDPPGWSDIQASILFVPFIQVAVQHLLEGRPESLNRVVGEPILRTVAKEFAEQAFDLLEPGGTRRRLGYPESVKGRPVLTVGDVAKAGLYRVVPADRDPGEDTPVLAINPDLRETDSLEAITQAALDERLGFSPTYLDADDAGTGFAGTERLRREWTLWILAAVLIVIGCEMLLAWLVGRPGGTKADQAVWQG